jgi:cytohesin
MKIRIASQWGGATSLVLWLTASGALAATNELSTALSNGLFEEEANHDLGAAIQMYQSVVDGFDTDRKLAATAVFRLGECYRKQGSTNEASVQYERVLREFADQTPLVALSRQYLAGLGGATTVQEQAGQSHLPKGVSERLANVIDVGEISRVQAIIQNSPDLINAPDASGQTLLQTYAGKGDLPVVELLLENGAAVNGIKQPDLTPLHFASGNGRKAVVELLLKKGAKVDAVTSSGVTPLHLAVLKGYELVAKVLLAAGANVNASVSSETSRAADSLRYSVSGSQTPLYLACSAGYLDLVELLISKGADVNAQDAKGWTPLTVAASANNNEMVNALLAAQADPNAGRSSALTLAAGSGNVAMIDLLLSKGAKVNLTDALREAVAKDHPAAVAKLIQLKADPDTKSATDTPLAFYALSDTNLLRVMLEGGANPNARDSQGDALLYRVAGTEETGSLELLLSHGADPNIKEHRGFTPLHFATGNSRTLFTRALLEHGANANLQTDNGETPLMFAVRARAPEVAKLLLEHGADPNLQDRNGQTALDFARQSLPGQPLSARPGHGVVPGSLITLEDLLLQHGASTDLPRMDRIEARRPPNYSRTIFSRSTNDVNRFSILELVAVDYGFISTTPLVFGGSSVVPAYNGHSRTIRESLPFPDLQKIEIRRPKPGGKGWITIPVAVQSILESGDCSRDVWLEWGDQVYIPEADHPLDAVWKGFSETASTNLQKCVQRTVQVIVKGEANTLNLKVPQPEGQYFPQGSESPFNYSPPQFCLGPALQRSGLLRSSSDLAHIKVTRRHPATDENWQKTFDCSGTTPLPSLWLRDGDVIEVPDKP